jgi:DNA-binding transcriptional MocR family regulator
VVLEDLAMADVAIDDLPLPPPIAALAPDATVHTIGSTAKLFWAGLRIGWIRSPTGVGGPDARDQDRRRPRLAAAQPAARQPAAGAVDEVAVERREQLRPRRDLLCRLLSERLPTWSWRRPAGGLSVWATLPHGNAEEFAELALRTHGVAVVPGPALSVDEGNRRSLRLVYACPEPDLEQGIERLAAAWADYRPSDRRAAARLLV